MFVKFLSAKIIFVFLFCLVTSPVFSADTPKKILYIVADGFGPQEMGLYLLYSKKILRNESGFEKLMKHGNNGLCLTYPDDGMVTDSAAAATALACGVKTKGGIIGLDNRGRKAENLMETAMKNKWGTGVISTTRLTHATPAGFSAHAISRNYESDIAIDQIESGIDVMMSGGKRFFIPKSEKGSKRRDQRNLMQYASQKGYSVYENYSDILSGNLPDKLLGLFTDDMMPFRIDEEACRGIPDLTSMVETAVKVLDKKHRNWVIMAEAGKIDFAGHSNDAGTMLKEIKELDELISWALSYQQRNRDFLVFLVSDHETGGFSFSYNDYNVEKPYTLNNMKFKPSHNFVEADSLSRISRQKKSFESIIYSSKTAEQLRENLMLYAGLNISIENAVKVLKRDTETVGMDKEFMSYGSVPANIISRVTMPQTGIVWSTGNHTSTPVVVSASGPGSRIFARIVENIDIAAAVKSFIKE